MENRYISRQWTLWQPTVFEVGYWHSWASRRRRKSNFLCSKTADSLKLYWNIWDYFPDAISAGNWFLKPIHGSITVHSISARENLSWYGAIFGLLTIKNQLNSIYYKHWYSLDTRSWIGLCGMKRAPLVWGVKYKHEWQFSCTSIR